MKSLFTAIIFSTIFSLGFGACKSLQQSSSEIITNKQWELTEIKGEKISDSTKFRKHPFIIFKTEENRLAGNGGCNSLNASYNFLGKNQVSISDIVTTRMACIGVDIEAKFLETLKATRSYKVKKNILQFFNEKGEIIAQFTLKKTTDNEQ